MTSQAGRPLRATIAGDVGRPRALAVSALGAALGTAIVLISGSGGPSGVDRPISRPHAVAAIGCASCHDSSALRESEHDTVPFFARTACVGCHAEHDHRSTRSGHRVAASRGELSCATCHPVHEGAQGVSFLGGRKYERWASGTSTETHDLPPAVIAPKGATVPLVALAACTRCHDPKSPRDPIAACVPRSPVDFVAWDAARVAVAESAWKTKPASSTSPLMPAFGALFGASAMIAPLALHARRKRRSVAPRQAPVLRPAERRRLPTINASTCLGCHACVDACPFDVLAVERYTAVVARPDECCGVLTCEAVCPNESLTISEGERISDQPSVDENLESRDVPGLFIAGDLSGVPLIKNAINQGAFVVDRVASRGAAARSQGLDVIIVGAGPAGLSAALRAKERGLSYVVLEQSTVAASIKSFPRSKIVYDPPIDLPTYGELWLRETTKEELVTQWLRIVRTRSLAVREHHRVVGVERVRDGAVSSFRVTTETEGAAPCRKTFTAPYVILAIGRRGTPRKLPLEIEEGAESNVSYALVDARSFAQKRVVIAGLGDGAMEAAIALAAQPGTSITMTYRGATFTRGKARTIAKVRELVTAGRIRIAFETVPHRVTKTAVTLASAHGESGASRERIAADALLVLVGGVPSWDLLTSAGIRRTEARDTHVVPPPGNTPL